MQSNYINGVWCDAVSKSTWAVKNPATEEIVDTISFGGAEDAELAIAAAVDAFPAWRKTNPWQRAEILRKVADLMREKARELGQITVKESGKPLAEAAGEWTVAAQFFEWYAEEGKRTYGKTIPSTRNNKRMSVIYQPIGPVGIITAWNFPVWNAARVWAASLAAGCTFVAKPSEYTPLTAIALIQLLAEAGIPPGVANLVHGEAAPIGEALLAHPDIRKIHFVGSTRVGKLLIAGSAKTNTRLSLELGGNAPCIVFPDVDVAATAKAAAMAKIRNCGQVCVSPQRFIVHNTIYEQFCAVMQAQLESITIGNGAETGIQIGPLINAKQRENIEKTVENSVNQGAKLLCGGKRPDHLDKGYFYLPTLLSDVKPDMDIFRQEVFGPVASITPFETTTDAVALANDTPYGLAAYLWTNDIKTSIAVSETLEFGIVGINDWTPHCIEAPFGGWKQSGQGYECGEEGLYEYLEKKLIATGI